MRQWICATDRKIPGLNALADSAVGVAILTSHGRSELQLSRSDSTPPSFSFSFSNSFLILKRITIMQWCKRSSINTTLTKFLLAEERFIGIGMFLPCWLSWRLSPWVFTAEQSVDQRRVSDEWAELGVESRQTNDTNETNWTWESGRFVHVKESFDMNQRLFIRVKLHRNSVWIVDKSIGLHEWTWMKYSTLCHVLK